MLGLKQDDIVSALLRVLHHDLILFFTAGDGFIGPRLTCQKRAQAARRQH